MLLRRSITRQYISHIPRVDRKYVFKRRRILRVVTETTAFGNSMAGALLPPIFLSLPWTSKHFYSKLQLDLYPTGSKSAVGIVPRTSR